MKILIGSAWPYANGSLHIGHLAALLPADVIARYYRAKGDDVYLVSGSDCHGTPVAIRAKQENKLPKEISDFYHEEFCECFNKLGFSYDHYGKTSSDEHISFVQEFHKAMYAGDYVYEQESPQAFCKNCNTALADRFVIGKCPDCKEQARGDQCDACGSVLDPENLLEPLCSICKSSPQFRPTRHLFIATSKLENELVNFLNSHPHWRKNAIAFTQRYIDEGLRDRAITRGIDWGIDVPKEGYTDKKIYVWAEAVLGYLSMGEVVAKQRGEDDIWGDDSRHYYVHGKDNIPFHTIILPSLMLAHGGKWRLPDDIISSEYLTLEGRRISTSHNWAIWVKDIIDRYNPDSIRYFLLASGPEKRDTDFTWREFVNSHNGELLGAYGNFINRTLSFIYKYYDAIVPDGQLTAEIETKSLEQFHAVSNLIESGNLREAIDFIFEFVRFGNKYFDSEQPWITRNTDAKACANTIYNCAQIIANLAVLLEPFLPFSSLKVKAWLAITDGWLAKNVPAGFVIPEPQILFERLDKKIVDEELQRLQQQ
ncbi:MAG: methionine--tRNA ligase [Defluviitaleaceae bacterium]|nr:methionine--tRNA ligase [Defluviitaleaceae bacterium]